MTDAPSPAAKRELGTAIRLALDVGPLILFFTANARAGIFTATALFMVAIVIAMAVANEAVWRNSTTDFWISYKLWGALPATLLFALANVPMLMRHGLDRDDAVAIAEPGPVE